MEVGEENVENCAENDGRSGNDYFSDLYPDDSAPEAVDMVLRGMGMEKYLELFKSEDITLDVLFELTEEDLVVLGIADEKDRQTFMEHFRSFHVGSPNHNKGFSYSMIDREEDDLIMARDIFSHMLELSTFCYVLNYRLGRSSLCDFFVSNRDTALGILALMVNHTLVQGEKISKLIHDGDSRGNSMVSTIAKTYNTDIPEELERLLAESSAAAKGPTKKRKAILLIAAAMSFVVVAVKMKKQVPSIWF